MCLTLGFRRGKEPQRGTSGGCFPSPANPCWGAGDRRQCPAFPRTNHRHPGMHRPVSRGRRRLPRRQTQRTRRSAPPCPGRPPGSVRPTGAYRARRGPGPDRVSARNGQPQTTAPTHARTRRPSSGTGRSATRPPRARAPGAGDTPPAPGGGGGASSEERLTPASPRPGPGATTTPQHVGWGARPTHQRARHHRGGTGDSTPVVWGRACRWAWDGSGWRRGPRGHRVCGLGWSCLVCLCSAPRQGTTLRAAAQRHASGAAANGSEARADAGSRRLHAFVS